MASGMTDSAAVMWHRSLKKVGIISCDLPACFLSSGDPSHEIRADFQLARHIRQAVRRSSSNIPSCSRQGGHVLRLVSTFTYHMMRGRLDGDDNRPNISTAIG